MPENTPLRHIPTIVVTTCDGTVFTCTVCLRDGFHPSLFRWHLTDAEGRSVMGPPYVPNESNWDVLRRIDAWWEVCKALERAATSEVRSEPAA